MGNTSLMLGTILSQLAVGTFLTGYVIDQVLGKAETKKAFNTSLAAFIAGLVGVIAVTTHLGVPTRMFNSFFNLGSSWLSREGLFYMVFMGLLFIYLLIQKGIIKAGGLKGVGALTALCGILLVFSASMIYMLPGVPAWNTAAAPVSFWLSALLMGVPLGVYLSGYSEGRVPALITGMVALFALLLTVVHVTGLQGGDYAQSASGFLMGGSGMYMLRLALLGVAGAYALYTGMKGTRHESAEGKTAVATGTGVFLILFIALVIAEVAGRMLFFSAIVRY